jgi:hypothetical protein
VKHTRALLAAVLAVLASCGDSSGPNNSGTLSFSYSGATSGSFNAAGRIPLGGQSETVEWAAGFRSDADGAIGVFASVPRDNSNHDFVVLQIGRLTIGSQTIESDCTADDCALVLVDLDADNDTGEAAFSCGLTDGTITLTSVTSTRAVGTFNGTGECFTTTGTGSFTITNGSFDVALISNLGI